MIQKPTKSWLLTLLLSIFVGGLGIDRFYLGHIGLGVGKLLVTLLSLGTVGWIWWIVDLILIATRKINSDGFYWDDSAEASYQKTTGGGYSANAS